MSMKRSDVACGFESRLLLAFEVSSKVVSESAFSIFGQWDPPVEDFVLSRTNTASAVELW